MKTAPKPRKKLPNGTIQKLAAALQCSPRHAQTLVAAGCPTDPAQALEWRRSQADGDPNTAELLRRARVKLVNEQERRVRLENDLKAGTLVDREQADGEARHVALAVKGALMALESTLPGGLMGLRSYGEIRTLLHKEFSTIMTKLHHGEFFNGAGVVAAVQEFYPSFKPTVGK